MNGQSNEQEAFNFCLTKCLVDFRLSLNVLTLSIESHNVYTLKGVGVSVNGIAQVRIATVWITCVMLFIHSYIVYTNFIWVLTEKNPFYLFKSRLNLVLKSTSTGKWLQCFLAQRKQRGACDFCSYTFSLHGLSLFMNLPSSLMAPCEEYKP